MFATMNEDKTSQWRSSPTNNAVRYYLVHHGTFLNGEEAGDEAALRIAFTIRQTEALLESTGQLAEVGRPNLILDCHLIEAATCPFLKSLIEGLAERGVDLPRIYFDHLNKELQQSMWVLRARMEIPQAVI